MSNAITETAFTPRKIGRSILALFAGFLVNVALSVGTDLALQAAGVLPVIGKAPLNNAQSLLAAAYRTAYAILSSYVVARLAPRKPMQHALVGAAIGMALASAGAAATWNQGLGPHWYALSLVVLALPTGWAGAKLWMASAR
jgi:hypothetical protein